MNKEEVFKKFEGLGYEHRIPKKYPRMIYLINDDDDPKKVITITINRQLKKYWKLWGDLSFEPFTLQEHQLLTELFKCEGWFD